MPSPAAAADAVIDAVLRPGDCLYLPRGWLHSATALGGVSTHLTFGIHTWTLRHLVDDLVRAAGSHLDDDPGPRARCRWGSTCSTRRPRLPIARRHAEPSMRRSTPSTTTTSPASWPVGPRAQRAEPLGVLAQHAAADRTHVHAWRVRDGLAPRWERPTLVTRIGRVAVPETALDAVRAVLTGALSPDVLHDDDLRRLVLAGMVVPTERAGTRAPARSAALGRGPAQSRAGQVEPVRSRRGRRAASAAPCDRARRARRCGRSGARP